MGTGNSLTQVSRESGSEEVFGERLEHTQWDGGKYAGSRVSFTGPSGHFDARGGLLDGRNGRIKFDFSLGGLKHLGYKRLVTSFGGSIRPGIRCGRLPAGPLEGGLLKLETQGDFERTRKSLCQ